MLPEYDLWAESMALIFQLPFHINWTWIKAHQESIKIDNNIVYGPLIRNDKVNHLCDKINTSS